VGLLPSSEEMLDFRRVFVHVQGARNLQLGGGGTVTVLVTTGTGKDCKAESEAVPASRTPTWNLETTLALPARARKPNRQAEAMVQFSVHRRHFLATEVVGSAAVRISALSGAGASPG
jgi:hypothetical protein